MLAAAIKLIVKNWGQGRSRRIAFKSVGPFSYVWVNQGPFWNSWKTCSYSLTACHLAFSSGITRSRWGGRLPPGVRLEGATSPHCPILPSAIFGLLQAQLPHTLTMDQVFATHQQKHVAAGSKVAEGRRAFCIYQCESLEGQGWCDYVQNAKLQ